MPTNSMMQLPPPKGWDEFEEMCADLFQTVWGDRNAERHGKNGQPQDGVDIHGRAGGQTRHIGVQCKGRENWPPQRLAKADILAEVEKAKSFQPPLHEFVIATTAPNHVSAQKTAREVTEAHSKLGLFSVHVWSWDKITRELLNHEQIAAKHYPSIQLLGVAQQIQAAMSSHTPAGSHYIDNEMLRAMQAIRKRRHFGSAKPAEEASQLVERISSGDLLGASSHAKAKTLAWCSRLMSKSNQSGARAALATAKSLGDPMEISIAEAFTTDADGDRQSALSALTAIDSPEARSAALIMVSAGQAASDTVKWFDQVGWEIGMLDPDGKCCLIGALMHSSDWDRAVLETGKLTNSDFEHTPVLRFLAAVAQVNQAVVEPQLRFVSPENAISEASRFPLASDASGLQHIRRARQLFMQAETATDALGLFEVAALCSDSALWLALRDPDARDEGMELLRASLGHDRHRIRRVSFALQFGVPLDVPQVEQEITRRNALNGGPTIETALARYSLAFAHKTPLEVAEYLSRHQSEIERFVTGEALLGRQVGMFAAAGQVDQAEEILLKLEKQSLDAGTIQRLKRVVREAHGADPIQERLQEYTEDPSYTNLANLVQLLEAKNDAKRICKFGQELFERTKTLQDAELLVSALERERRYSEIVELVNRFADFVAQSEFIHASFCQALFQTGDVLRCQTELSALRVRHDRSSYRVLSVFLSITTGNWSAVAVLAEEQWNDQSNLSSVELLQAAELSQRVGHTRTRDLINAAIAKAEDDPRVFLGAYTIATSGGWENEPEVGVWFKRAIELSGDSGPIRNVTFKELLDQKPDWDRRELDIWEKQRKAQLPLFMVAQALNRSILDLSILPAFANEREPDVRRRGFIPSFSGRPSQDIGSGATASFDMMSILTLASLELLPAALDAFSEVVLPHSLLENLFEAHCKAQLTQPSQVPKAEELRELISESHVTVLQTDHPPASELLDQVGPDLAIMLTIARTANATKPASAAVVRSAPVHRVASFMDEEADLTVFSSELVSCAGLVDWLKLSGTISGEEAEKAVAFLDMQEDRWPNEPDLSQVEVIYLDDLSISYLQSVGLLSKVASSFKSVFVSASLQNRSAIMLRHKGYLGQGLSLIESVRKELHERINAGKVQLSTSADVKQSDKRGKLHDVIFELIALSGCVDFIVADDRFTNQNDRFENGGKASSCVSSIDVLKLLWRDKKITNQSFVSAMCKLRQRGYIVVPVSNWELQFLIERAQIANGKIVETAELRAWRQSLLLMQMRDALAPPHDLLWLFWELNAVNQALKSQWRPAIEVDLVIARSRYLFGFLDVRRWAHAYGDENGGNIAQELYSQLLMRLLIGDPQVSRGMRKPFLEWFDRDVLGPLEQSEPEVYAAVKRRAALLLSSVEPEGDE